MKTYQNYLNEEAYMAEHVALANLEFNHGENYFFWFVYGF